MSDIGTYLKWIKTIEKQKKWLSYTEWSNHEFEIISDEISELTGVKISRNTIRNVIEKVKKNDLQYNPQAATKNAFAVYVGYKNWERLERKNKPLFARNKAYFYGILLLPILLATLVLLFLLPIGKAKSVDDIGNFSFEVENRFGTAPHTVRCKYDFSELNTDDIYIDYHHVAHDGKYLLRKVENPKGFQTQCYHFPGIYKFNLFIDGVNAYNTKVVVNTKGWFIHAKEAKIQEVAVPDFLDQRGFLNPRRVLFDHVLDKNITQEGYLHIPQERIAKIDGLSNNHLVSIQNIQDYGIQARNGTLKVRFKNEDLGKRIHCYIALLMLQGEHGNIELKIAEKGCSEYTFLRLGDSFYSAKDNNIKFLEIDFSNFIEAEIRSNNHEVSFYAGGKLLHTMKSQQDLGKLLGISMQFKNSPHLDYVELYNTNGELVFADYFDSYEEN